MKRYKKLQNQQGMTIIELLVSLVILTILFTGAMQFFPQSYSYTRVNQSKTVGTNVARNALQYMQGQSFLKVKKEFESPNESRVLKLYICERTLSSNAEEKYYQYQDQTLPIPSNCGDIRINNLNYKVTITRKSVLKSSSNSDPNYDSSIIPLQIDVNWTRNNIDLRTKIEGDLVSEDIRESNS